MVADVRKAIDGWEYSVASIGYPGPVVHGKPVSEPHNLGCYAERYRNLPDICLMGTDHH